MSIADRYSTADGLRGPAIIRDAVIAIGALILVMILWPFYSVPTGSRGVITQFGKIVGIEPEGLAVLPPWQKLTLFSIRSDRQTLRMRPVPPAIRNPLR